MNFLHQLKELLQCPEDVKFPAPQPVSLSRENLGVIQRGNRAYMVCEKTDGVRALVFFTQDASKQNVLISFDRTLKTERIHERIHGAEHKPNRFCYAETLFLGTVLDCEKVELGGGMFKLVVFDCYALAGRKCTERNLRLRLAYAKTAVQNCDPDLFDMKPMLSLQDFRRLVALEQGPRPRITEARNYKSDGFVFTPVQDRVKFKAGCTVFKYKQRQDHTCDFLVRRVSARRRTQSYCWEVPGHELQEVADLVGTPATEVELWFMTHDRLTLFTVTVWPTNGLPELQLPAYLQPDLDPSLVPTMPEQVWEFRLQLGVWVPVRPRPDKLKPNFRDTVLDTLRCLEDNLQLHEI
jgi:hypothetical protein